MWYVASYKNHGIHFVLKTVKLWESLFLCRSGIDTTNKIYSIELIDSNWFFSRLRDYMVLSNDSQQATIDNPVGV